MSSRTGDQTAPGRALQRGCGVTCLVFILPLHGSCTDTAHAGRTGLGCPAESCALQARDTGFEACGQGATFSLLGARSCASSRSPAGEAVLPQVVPCTGQACPPQQLRNSGHPALEVSRELASSGPEELGKISSFLRGQGHPRKETAGRDFAAITIARLSV